VHALHKRKDLAVLKVVASRRSIELGALMDIEKWEPFMTISTGVEYNCRTYMFGFAWWSLDYGRYEYERMAYMSATKKRQTMEEVKITWQLAGLLMHEGPLVPGLSNAKSNWGLKERRLQLSEHHSMLMVTCHRNICIEEVTKDVQNVCYKGSKPHSKAYNSELVTYTVA